MAYSSGQSHHRLPGFAHFESPFSLSSNCHSSSSLDPLVFKFSCTDTLGDGPIASTAGLDLSIVNGLDLTSSNYAGLNLSNNAGDRNGSNNHSSNSNNHQAKSNQSHMSQNMHQQNINSGFGQSQGVENSSEMVLNLSTQIGLNLTRPGQELDYSDMLNIDQQSTFNTGLQDNDFEYYSDYYTNYTDPLNMEQQRSSPLNLEHRSSPLNLTAVGTIGRKRRSTNFNQYNQGVSNFLPGTSGNLQSTVPTNSHTNHHVKSTGKSMNILSDIGEVSGVQNAPISLQLSTSLNSSTVQQSSMQNYNMPVAATNASLNSQQLPQSSYAVAPQQLQNSSMSSQMPLHLSSNNQEPLMGTSNSAADSLGLPAATEIAAQTAPLDMGKTNLSQQNLVQEILKIFLGFLQSVKDFSFNNQAFDYRLPNKLTSFYNQQNENCFNESNSTNIFTNQKSSLHTQSDLSTKTGGKLKVTAVKDPEYDISFSYIDNYNDDAPFTAHNSDNYDLSTNYLLDLNTCDQGPSTSGYTRPVESTSIGKTIPRKETNKVHLESKRFSCYSCSQSFSDDVKLNTHIKSEHSASQVRNSDFTNDFLSSGPVNLSPMKNRTNNEPIPKIINKIDNIKPIIKSPILKPKKVFKCNVCSDTFTFQSACKRHEKLHDNIKPFSCEKCHKKFSRNFDLKNHVRTHSDCDSSKCSKCKEDFPADRNEHKCSVEEPPKYPCPICPRSLNSKREWGAHMWKHTGESKYIIMSEDKELPLYVPKKDIK